EEEAELKAEAFAHGANDYIIKWPEPIELLARLRYHSRWYINLKSATGTADQSAPAGRKKSPVGTYEPGRRIDRHLQSPFLRCQIE
ncbi:MAG: hypothetical protein ABW153_18000, partial [Sedimenticola sp.]